MQAHRPSSAPRARGWAPEEGVDAPCGTQRLSSRRKKSSRFSRRLLKRCVPQGASTPSSGAHPRARGSEGSRSALPPSLKPAALRGGVRVQGAQIA